MKRFLSARGAVKLAIFAAFIVTLGVIIRGNQPYFASIAYPPIPQSHYQFIDDAVDHCKIPKSERGLIAALAWKESTFHEGSVSGAGAIGVTQVLRSTAFGVAQKYQIAGLDARTITNPALNYKLGSCYLKDKVSEFGSGVDADWENANIVRAALIAYNAGPARGRSFLSGNYSGPSSSLGYAERIIQAEKIYNFDFVRHDQAVATGENAIDPLKEVRNLVWSVLLRNDAQ